jgi:hypothetical protein
LNDTKILGQISLEKFYTKTNQSENTNIHELAVLEDKLFLSQQNLILLTENFLIPS